MIEPYYEQDGITIYNADCREILPYIQTDVLVTDPPYGVDLGDVVNGQARAKQQQPYSQFSDTPKYLQDVCVPAIRDALTRVKRGALFCGNRNLWLYPQADEVGCWYVPAATSRGKWGFICANLILYYGKSPRAGIGDFANSFSLQPPISKSAHPCPKPYSVMRWLVNKSATAGDVVFDPFMGSGTTLQAAKDLGLRAVGVEIEERYCELAVKRLSQSILNFEEVA